MGMYVSAIFPIQQPPTCLKSQREAETIDQNVVVVVREVKGERFLRPLSIQVSAHHGVAYEGVRQGKRIEYGTSNSANGGAEGKRGYPKAWLGGTCYCYARNRF
ncbi:hypothetical protein SESBI_29552 [Sesbania bispinosa]|nr:hypothetical protein SESBI_29552 [Sesbania bispinosa]